MMGILGQLGSLLSPAVSAGTGHGILNATSLGMLIKLLGGQGDEQGDQSGVFGGGGKAKFSDILGGLGNSMGGMFPQQQRQQTPNGQAQFPNFLMPGFYGQNLDLGADMPGFYGQNMNLGA